MRLLYLGDIMGRPGRALVTRALPALKAKHSPDLVVAQGENVTHGKGLSPTHYRELKAAGIDFFTGGNHILAEAGLEPFLKDPAEPVVRPANYPAGTPGARYKFIETSKGRVLIFSLLGQIVGKDALVAVDNPLHVADEILEATKSEAPIATLVNFHGDYSSEKRVIGYYLDGRVTAVLGDHWHVPSADAMVLPGGTAHISDVGMVGTLHASLGVETDIIIKRWREGKPSRNVLATKPPYQLCAVLVESDPESGLAQKITQIIEYFDN